MRSAKEIRQLLDHLREWNAPKPFLEREKHDSVLDDPIDLESVQEFEADNRIKLPEDYREFILTIGCGGAGPYLGLLPLSNNIHHQLSARRPDYLQHPFPLTDHLRF